MELEFFQVVLPIVIDVLLIVLITVGIIIGIKCIYIMDKAKDILQNVEDKVNTLNGLFAAIALVNDKINLVGEKIYSLFEGILAKFVNKKKRDLEEEAELEEILNEEMEDY